MKGQDRMSGHKMYANQANGARTRQYFERQENNLVWDEQLDDEVLKTNEAAKHWVYASEEGCEILKMLWLPLLLPKGFERQPFTWGYCTAEKIYSLNRKFYGHLLSQLRKINQQSRTMNWHQLWLEVSTLKLRFRKIETITLLSLVSLLTTIAWHIVTMRKRLVSHSRILPLKSGESAKTTSTLKSGLQTENKMLKSSWKLRGSKTFSNVFLNPD